MKIIVLFIVMLFGSLSYAKTETVNGASYVTVSPSGIAGGCDFADVTSAVIGLGGATEIRVVDGTYDEEIVINSGLTIKGGYTNCANAVSDIQGSSRPTLNAFSSSSIIYLNGSSGDVYLENINIATAATTMAHGAGLYAFDHDGLLSFNNVTFQNNYTTNNGGALWVRTLTGGINTQVEIVDSHFINNTAHRGGGLYCSAGSVGQITINVSGNSLFQSNRAEYTTGDSGRGGAIYSSACIINFYSAENNVVASGIDSNTADREGGGLYADRESLINFQGFEFCDGMTCKGNNAVPVRLTNNSAANGGAIYATGINTYVELVHGYIHGNSASTTGGAVDIRDSSLFFVRRNSVECWNREKCNLFSENLAIPAGLGGVIYNQSPNVEIQNAFFEDNSADLGVVVYTLGAGANTKIINSVFNHNGGDSVSGYVGLYLIRSFSDASTELYHVTIADNTVNGGLLGIQGSTELILQNSIIYGTGDVINTASQGVTNVSCLVAHELDSFVTPPTGHSLATPNPFFENPANRDYHLTRFSAAIDRCAASSVFTPRDMDFEIRPWDDPVSNLGGSYDAGADETYAGDIIFEDGFE